MIASEKEEARWPDDDSIDHRTMQDVHDLLAAAWRFEASPAQFALGETRAAPVDRMDEWLRWLRTTVEAWSSKPERVRTVMLIITNQNTQVGYVAEDQLRNYLAAEYEHIPWDTPRFKISDP